MAKNRVKIQIKGSKVDNELVRLSEFLSELDAVNGVLNGIDRAISESKSSTLYFRIVNLGLTSPPFVEIEAVPKKALIDQSVAVVDRFFQGLEDIKRSKAPPQLDWQVIESYGSIGKSFERNVAKIVFANDDHRVELTKGLQRVTEKILGEEGAEYSSVSGILEYVNIHGGANKFYIYPITGAGRINCNFPTELLKEAIGAIGKRINVEGETKCRKEAPFPYAVKVQKLQVYPEESELPSLLDLRGMAPDATGSLSSEEFIAKIRHERQ